MHIVCAAEPGGTAGTCSFPLDRMNRTPWWPCGARQTRVTWSLDLDDTLRTGRGRASAVAAVVMEGMEEADWNRIQLGHVNSLNGLLAAVVEQLHTARV